jgi:periplasmic divalent cation tolerance protein
MTVISIYAVFADQAEAERIGRVMIEERLAACINILAPVHSIYRWEGAVQTSDEVAAILKTTERNAKVAIARIAELHSYEVPCVVTWPIDAIFGPYAKWVQDSCD